MLLPPSKRLSKRVFNCAKCWNLVRRTIALAVLIKSLGFSTISWSFSLIFIKLQGLAVLRSPVAQTSFWHLLPGEQRHFAAKLPNFAAKACFLCLKWSKCSGLWISLASFLWFAGNSVVLICSEVLKKQVYLCGFEHFKNCVHIIFAKELLEQLYSFMHVQNVDGRDLDKNES